MSTTVAPFPGTRTAPPREVSTRSLSWLLTAILLAVFIPEGLSLFVFGFRLSPVRLLLLVILPFILMGYGRLILSKEYRLVLSDIFFPLAFVWMIAAPANVDGLASALRSGGAIAMDFTVAYSAVRILLHNTDDTHAFIRLFCIASGVVGLSGMLDTLTDFHVLHDWIAEATGYIYFQLRTDYDADVAYRLGLFRAEGPLEHPILFGIVMCYALLLSRDLVGAAKNFCRIGCGIGLFLSLSSAPWTGLILGVALMFYGRVVNFSHRWLMLIAVTVLLSVIFFMVMVNPWGWIFSHMIINSESGYYRLMVWDIGGNLVMQSPIVGVGMTDNWYRPDWMPATVDSLWLRSAMTFGIPGSLLIAFSLIGASSLSVKQTKRNASTIGPREVRLAETLGIITFLTIYLGFTVHYWGACWCIIGVLAGVRAHLGQLANQ